MNYEQRHRREGPKKRVLGSKERQELQCHRVMHVEMRDLRAAQWNFGAIKPPCHACHRDRGCPGGPSSIVAEASRRPRMAEFSYVPVSSYLRLAGGVDGCNL
jgi:hypothetical protein